jgi:iron complex outermembrane receptor protein
MFRFSFLIVLFASDILVVRAQDTVNIDSTKILQEVTVSYQADKLTPVTYLDISREVIETKSNVQEPSFVLAQTPSITNYSDAGSGLGYSYFRLRGIDQTRINITLDGVPLNEPEDQGAYFSNYPDLFNSLSKVQVQRGVGTSKNGVASFGGSVQLYSPNLHDTADMQFGFGYGSYNSLRGYLEYNSGICEDKALYVRISELYSDGYKYNSSNHSQSIFVSSGLFKERRLLKVNILAGHQANELAWLGVSDSLIAVDRRTNSNENESDDFIQCMINLQYSEFITEHSSIQNGVYYTFLRGNYDFNLNAFLGFPSTNELYNYAFQSNMLGVYSAYHFVKRDFEWITGIHSNIYSRSHSGSEVNSGLLYSNVGEKFELSVFTKLNYKLKNIVLFADIQGRYTTFSYDGSVKLDILRWSYFNPKIGAGFTVGKAGYLYYSFGHTGREPTRNDIFLGNDDLVSDSLGLPITGVTSSEYVFDHEFGYRYIQKRLHVNCNVYYMQFRNEIVLQGKFGPNGLALTNSVDRSFRCGMELNLTYDLGNYFQIVNNSAFNISRIREQQQIIIPVLTPAVVINQEIITKIQRFSFAVSGRYQSGSFIDFANTVKLKDYYLLALRFSYVLKKMQFALFVNNLTSSDYYNQGYMDPFGTARYFAQAPINIHASAMIRF